VCFAEADFSQRQSYSLAPGASLVLVDWITAGRHAAGERWDFARYDSRILYSRDERLILLDGILLERSSDAPVADRMGRFRVYLTAVITGPLVAAGAEDILSAVSRAPIAPGAELVESASALEDGGIILRMAGIHTEQVGLALRRRLAFLHPLLGDDPWARKW
jgi:urease accessory protein